MAIVDPQTREVRDFLLARRERLTPQQAGLSGHHSRRRVKGLRREEVAFLAGMSADYYTRLERGNLAGVSDEVLGAVARALQLSEAERVHLFNLARNASRRLVDHAVQVPRDVPEVRPGVHRILDSISTPAYVRTDYFEVLALNEMGRALFIHAAGGESRFNIARFVFLDPRSREFYGDWTTVARATVAALRLATGRAPGSPGLGAVIADLARDSAEFHAMWSAHDVTLHRTATKVLVHPVVGEIQLTGERLDLPGDPGLSLITYTVDPASRSAQALAFLESWCAQERAETRENSEVD